MAIPEHDLELIRRFCDEQVPPEFHDRVRVECVVRGRTVTIIERRPEWAAEPGHAWQDIPQARLKYDDQSAGWTLYWFDSNSRAHRYELLEPNQAIERLLAEYDADPTGIFKG